MLADGVGKGLAIAGRSVEIDHHHGIAGAGIGLGVPAIVEKVAKGSLRAAMDQVIKQKFQELEESGTGSTKDIADLLALSHKMSMEYLDRQIELQKLQAKQTELQVKNQVNVQINEGVPIGDGSKYAQLIGKLLESNRDASN